MTEDESQTIIRSSERRKDELGRKKRIDSIGNIGKSSSKNKSGIEKENTEKNKDPLIAWTKIIGRKEKRRSAKEEISRKDRRKEKREKEKEEAF